MGSVSTFPAAHRDQDFFDNSNKENANALHDLGLAMGNFTHQASLLNIIIHHMAGFDQSLARELFKIPVGYDPASMAVLGYADDEKAKRKRKPIHEFVFDTEFEHSKYLKS